MTTARLFAFLEYQSVDDGLRTVLSPDPGNVPDHCEDAHDVHILVCNYAIILQLDMAIAAYAASFDVTVLNHETAPVI